MRDLESLLRSELNTMDDSISPPSAAALLDSTRRIRRRQRVFAHSSTAVAVVAVITVVAVLLTGQPSAQPAHRVATPVVPMDSYPGFTAKFIAAVLAGNAIGGRFVDSRHGVLEIQVCDLPPTTAGSSQPGCGVSISVTDDGGATFVNRPLPAGVGESPSLYVFDANDLVLLLEPPQADIARRWVSHNGGASWQTVPATSVGTVATIPAGAQLYSDDPSTKFETSVYVLTADGVARRLTGVPDGRVWDANPELGNISYTGANHGEFFLNYAPGGPEVPWMTGDDGRTWQKLVLPEPVSDFQMLGFDGTHFFAKIQPSNFDTASPPDARLYLITSTDGLHWQSVPLPTFTAAASGTGSLDAEDYPNLVSAPSTPSAGPTSGSYSSYLIDAAMSVGGLLLCDETTLWRISPGKTTFEPIVGAPSTSRLTGFGAVVTAYRGDGHNIEVDLTADGVHWHKAAFR